MYWKYFILKINRLKDLLHANNKINSLINLRLFKKRDWTNKNVTYCILFMLNNIVLYKKEGIFDKDQFLILALYLLIK